jgi:phosphoketolase
VDEAWVRVSRRPGLRRGARARRSEAIHDQQRPSDTGFTADRPVIFAFHGYPWLVHRLAARNWTREHGADIPEVANSTWPA